MTKLREMYRMMNVQAIARNVKQHKQRADKGSKTPSLSDDFLTGAFNVHVAYAENIKPTLKTGASNPYVLVRVPEGTVVPPAPSQPANRKKNISPSTKEGPTPEPAPTILTGSGCELFKSRVINETLNPNWDESHSVILPPIERLEVAVFSKNLLTSDDIAGSATIDLSIGTKLRRKLVDLQTHDVFVELEPQGRVLLRLKLEGEEEDVDFWFRRTNERLIRTRDSFLRSLTTKVIFNFTLDYTIH
jgi:C2 domain